MSNVYFISDLHLGHKKILEFSPRRGGTDVQSHSEWLVDRWNSRVNKNDIVWVLGDVAFDRDHMKYLKQMRGQKNLILGNHDNWSLEYYHKYFNRVHGFLKKYGMWLSHAPLHPNHLRGIKNIHGHLHSNSVVHIGDNDLFGEVDTDYINVCVEQLNGVPVSLEEVK